MSLNKKMLEMVIGDIVYKSLKKLLIDDGVLEKLLESTVKSAIKCLKETTVASGGAVEMPSSLGHGNIVSKIKKAAEKNKNKKLQNKEEPVSEKEEEKEDSEEKRKFNLLQKYIDEDTLFYAENMRKGEREQYIIESEDQQKFDVDGGDEMQLYEQQFNQELVSLDKIKKLIQF